MFGFNKAPAPNSGAESSGQQASSSFSFGAPKPAQTTFAFGGASGVGATQSAQSRPFGFGSSSLAGTTSQRPAPMTATEKLIVNSGVTQTLQSFNGIYDRFSKSNPFVYIFYDCTGAPCQKIQANMDDEVYNLSHAANPDPANYSPVLLHSVSELLARSKGHRDEYMKARDIMTSFMRRQLDLLGAEQVRLNYMIDNAKAVQDAIEVRLMKILEPRYDIEHIRRDLETVETDVNTRLPYSIKLLNNNVSNRNTVSLNKEWAALTENLRFRIVQELRQQNDKLSEFIALREKLRDKRS